jgi:aspartate aminotransferase
MEDLLMEKPATKSISAMADGLVGSEIIKLANDVNEKINQGNQIYNLTIGDFNPSIFPIPENLKNEIVSAYHNGHTNYPAANGIVELRKSVSQYLFRKGGVSYTENEVLIAGGGRPLIYGAYQVILDPGDSVIFPTPSWNNNHYCHIVGAKPIQIETVAQNNFMPTAEELKPYIEEANLIALCSPLNPTGTTFSKEGLEEICDLVLEENQRRGTNQKPIYILFDQIYWQLTFGETQHYNPVILRPEIKDYVVFIDGMSKAFSGTGIRVGWGFGPLPIINKMKSVLSHLGAWAPKAEQIATAKYLDNANHTDIFIEDINARIQKRLTAFYNGFKTLKSMGHKVDAIAPQAAMYLTVQIDLKGSRTQDGSILESTEDITSFLLNQGGIALVPFYAFGADKESTWYRLSVGTTSMEDIDGFFDSLRNVLSQIS